MERVAWARAHMPLLRELEAELARTRPFLGITIGICLHIEPKTAVLATALASGGASIAITGSPGTTQNDVADWLASSGFEVHGRREDGIEEHRRNLARVMERRPDLLLDNGADLVALLVERGLRAIGATEETTTGANRLREELSGRVAFPVIVINDSPLKSIVENQHGVGQTVSSAFLQSTNLGIAGRRFAVLGFGWCGRGIARCLSAVGGRVAVVEPDSIRALEAALEGFDVLELEEAIPRCEVFVTATGKAGSPEAGALRAPARRCHPREHGALLDGDRARRFARGLS